MNRVTLLDALKAESEIAIGDLLLPVAMQKEDEEQPPDRAAEVHLMRLPDSLAAKKKAPYIIHQVITGKDFQRIGTDGVCRTPVRSIFCVYHPNEEEGALALLNLMERIRIHLLETVIIGDGQFELDLDPEQDAGLEVLLYPDDTAPYYAGEMITVWKLPFVRRNVRRYL